jgi:hypothetical protein
LTKDDEIEIGYKKELYKKFEKLYFQTLGAIVIMHYLRFNDKSAPLNLNFLIKSTGNIIKYKL